ncbi:exported hypothetical protein [Rhodospirillaceae bacterium LM-1]|nr:exported hypothetical protein [Rhodospirillaceae bacterium LM-1]
MSKRKTLAAVLLSLALVLGGSVTWLFGTNDKAVAQQVDVWKSASCGCCGGWVDYMKKEGFKLSVQNTEEMDAVKAKHGVPEALASCHTATIDGYVIEGHVPAQDIRRLLSERPKARGLSAPGMPQDAPGMDGNTGQPYQVYLFRDDGTREVFARH